MSVLHPQQSHSFLRRMARMGILGLVVGSLTACQTVPAAPPNTPAPGATGAAQAAVAAASAVTDTVGSGEVTDADPLPLDQTTGPVRLQIPALELDVPVIAMGWRVAMVNGARTTVWDVPSEEVGWHMNSAGAGGAGNVVISGRQADGAALFAPLALGAVEAGQEILLTDGDGIVFVYRMREVTDPIPITGATADEEAQAEAFFAPTEEAQLTLVTGWPEFTTTHRVFAVADYVGVMQ